MGSLGVMMIYDRQANNYKVPFIMSNLDLYLGQVMQLQHSKFDWKGVKYTFMEAPVHESFVDYVNLLPKR